MKWVQALAAFLTLLLIITRSRCLITNFNTRKPVHYTSFGASKPRALASRRRRPACARAADADDSDAKIWRDPDIIVEDKALGDYECDR